MMSEAGLESLTVNGAKFLSCYGVTICFGCELAPLEFSASLSPDRTMLPNSLGISLPKLSLAGTFSFVHEHYLYL